MLWPSLLLRGLRRKRMRLPQLESQQILHPHFFQFDSSSHVDSPLRLSDPVEHQCCGNSFNSFTNGHLSCVFSILCAAKRS